ncbi:MAG TPA: class I SAM-dependent methyltransferase [Acidimicrobiales bacterium]|nr:class I SAM-dependent methyltransferase [Acidimicrobiales bacterium]
MTDLALVKAKQQAAWSSGDYASVGNRILLVSELLCDAVDLRAGERVLDVATGAGNAALAAARRFATVTGVDYVPELLEQARVRAAADGLAVDFRVGDAEALEFADESFDVVLSACGAMFAPDHHKTASELVRVCRPGGRIGMVNWCPDSYVGALFRTIAKYVPPAPGVTPPGRWGDEIYLKELWGDDVTLKAPRKSFLFRFPSPEHHVDFFAQYYGPTLKAFEAVGEEGRAALRADILEAVQAFNRAEDGTLVLQMDYLEVVATKR